MAKSSERWTNKKSIETYNIDRWGAEYFSVNKQGHMIVNPLQDEGPSLSIYDVAKTANANGVSFPMLIRFQDLLRHRVEKINQTFQEAIDKYHFQGSYRGVFPIKVNQLREVVEEIIDAGEPYHFGLEVGSKPELLAALAVHQDPESLIICNGYKDTAFIRLALLGRKLGKKLILVIEKMEELQRVLDVAKDLEVEPLIGVRIRLQTKGTGRWALSGGESAKFGLSTSDLIETCRILEKANMKHCFQLLHFHVGSQIPDILTLQKAVNEAARYFAKLYQLDFHLNYFDVGGGLGIDYDGSGTSSHSSINYTLREYTRDIVKSLCKVCKEENVPHPTIVSESGRSIVTHHSVLLVEAFGAIEKTRGEFIPASSGDHDLAIEISKLVTKLNKRNRRESLHRGLQIKEECATRFELGLLDLHTKAKVETAFWHLAEEIVKLFKGAKQIPEEVIELSEQLSDQFLCNFSVFQSLIDHWAVNQLFPIAPIHRLNEKPTHDATLVDITCDSDGKIDKFIDFEDIASTLPLHTVNGKPYILGLFLVGAYQDVMGDLHNLFGTVSEAHVFLDDDEAEGFYIEETIDAASISDVLDEVQWDAAQLSRLMKMKIDKAIKSGLLKPKRGIMLLSEYEAAIKKSTYLDLQPRF
ncbi:MAG: biosynthetic arginine decarboxylase [Verrucomicrobiota bacterium]